MIKQKSLFITTEQKDILIYLHKNKDRLVTADELQRNVKEYTPDLIFSLQVADFVYAEGYNETNLRYKIRDMGSAVAQTALQERAETARQRKTFVLTIVSLIASVIAAIGSIITIIASIKSLF